MLRALIARLRKRRAAMLSQVTFRRNIDLEPLIKRRSPAQDSVIE
jgi:hypothetical protein